MASTGKSCYGPRLVETHSTSDAARLAAVFTGLLLVASVPVGLAADASGLPAQAGPLRADQAALEARANAATLELYALEVQFGRARTAVEELTAQRAALAGERAAARKRLVVARKALLVSQGRLADLVRTLYEHTGAADPLAILLGATSFEEALAGLDGLSRAAGENNRIIEQARASRQKLSRLDARLASQEIRLRRLTEAARARATELSTATAARRAYIAGLRERQGLIASQITSIQATARKAEARSVEITAASPPVATPAVATPGVEPTPSAAAPAAGGRTLTVSATGYALRGRTATGVYTAPGVVAVDPSVIPLGTRMTIPGYGEGVAADTGGAVHGNIIDLWFPTVEQALQWGRRTVTIVLH
jgi:3D (Asp-Asp-Asp) domain-containing protein